mgnify:CR=1 FL=1
MHDAALYAAATGGALLVGAALIVVGGVVPPQDYDALRRAGVEAIFPPGTVIAEAAEGLLNALNRRLGHAQAAE